MGPHKIKSQGCPARHGTPSDPALSMLLAASVGTTLLHLVPTLFRDALLPGECARLAIHDHNERTLLEGQDLVGQLILRDGRMSATVPVLVVVYHNEPSARQSYMHREGMRQSK